MCLIKHPLFSYWQKTTLLALVIAYLVQNIFAFDSLAISLYIYSILAFILFGTTKPDYSENTTQSYLTYSFLVILLTPIVIYQLNISPIKANKEYTLSLKYFSYQKHVGKCAYVLAKEPHQAKKDFLHYCNKVQKYGASNDKTLFPAFDLMDKALSRKTNISYPLLEYLLNLANIQHLFSETEQARYKNLINAAKNQLQQHFEYDEKLNSLYGYYLYMLGNKLDADKYLLKSLSLAPKKYTTINKIAETRILNGEIEKAKRILDIARSFGPHKETEKLYKNIKHLKGMDSF